MRYSEYPLTDLGYHVAALGGPDEATAPGSGAE